MRHPSPSSRLPALLLLIALLFSVYTLTNAGRFHIVDEVSLFSVTESLARRGQVDTNAIAWTQWVNSPGEVLGANGPTGETYSKKGPAPAFVSLPWYALMWLAAWTGLPMGILQGVLLWNGLVTGVTAALLWLTAIRLGYSERTGRTLALLFGLSTLAWPYANHLFGEPLSAFSLLLTFYALLGWKTGMIQPSPPSIVNHQSPLLTLALAGLGAALAITTVTAHALLVAVLGSYLLYASRIPHPAPRIPHPASRITLHASHSTHRAYQNWARFALGFGGPILVSLGLLAWYNFARFGSVLESGYHFDSGEGFTTPLGQGLWGLLLSPYRGLFWHTPLFLASLAAWIPFTRRHRAEGLTILGLSGVLIGLYSIWWMWWGGFAWGPRFLVPLGPFWVLLLAEWVERGGKKWATPEQSLGSQPSSRLPIWLLGLGGLSALVQVAAVSVNYVNFEIQLREIFATDWADPLKFGPPAQALSDWSNSPVLGQFRLMAQDLAANTDLAWLGADGVVNWPVLVTGLVTVLGLALLLRRWLTQESAQQVRLIWAAAALLPLFFTAVWLVGASQDPTYGQSDQGYRAILDKIETEGGSQDVVVTVAPFHYHLPMNWYTGRLPIYGYAADSMAHLEAVKVMAQLIQRSTRIWFITAGLPPADPHNSLERWLAEHAYKATDEWFGDFRLVRYGTGFSGGTGREVEIGEILGDGANQVEILGATVPEIIQPGMLISVAIRYRLLEPVTQDLRWFVQLLGPDGAPVALLDTGPVDGYTGFSGLPSGIELTEQAGLQTPSSLPNGEYSLIGGLYNPMVDGAPRLQGKNGQESLLLWSGQLGGQ